MRMSVPRIPGLPRVRQQDGAAGGSWGHLPPLPTTTLRRERVRVRICLGAPGLDCQARTEAPRCPRCQALWKARRRALYGGNWNRYSRTMRATTPWCSVCGTQEDLTMDHETG